MHHEMLWEAWMQGGDFSGKFLTPTEAFSVQHFNYADLNRFAPEIFITLVALVAAGLALHFVLSRLAARRNRKAGPK
jgi:hypothetical protein